MSDDGLFQIVILKKNEPPHVLVEGGLYVPDGKLATSTLPASLRMAANALENGAN
jgi:hypothetical protein